MKVWTVKKKSCDIELSQPQIDPDGGGVRFACHIKGSRIRYAYCRGAGKFSFLGEENVGGKKVSGFIVDDPAQTAEIEAAANSVRDSHASQEEDLVQSVLAGDIPVKMGVTGCDYPRYTPYIEVPTPHCWMEILSEACERRGYRSDRSISDKYSYPEERGSLPAHVFDVVMHGGIPVSWKEKLTDLLPLREKKENLPVFRVSGGMYSTECWIPKDAWQAVKDAGECVHWDEEFLEDNDMFSEKPGWFYTHRGLEILKEKGFRFTVKGVRE